MVDHKLMWGEVGFRTASINLWCGTIYSIHYCYFRQWNIKVLYFQTCNNIMMSEIFTYRNNGWLDTYRTGYEFLSSDIFFLLTFSPSINRPYSAAVLQQLPVVTSTTTSVIVVPARVTIHPIIHPTIKTNCSSFSTGDNLNWALTLLPFTDLYYCQVYGTGTGMDQYNLS